MKKIKLLVVALVAMLGYGQMDKNDTEAIAALSVKESAKSEPPRNKIGFKTNAD